ncbi:hypothetical protein E2C01_088422 [Portunus trituberculatus]|uniref:Uncharacterized protein n=1 Tax=Portunus trituberculatus TaxID=210409 RepID=A0A5B7JJT7_PORTR|nr:hypothetical protein [Portunus trituberculatus]
MASLGSTGHARQHLSDATLSQVPSSPNNIPPPPSPFTSYLNMTQQLKAYVVGLLTVHCNVPCWSPLLTVHYDLP